MNVMPVHAELESGMLPFNELELMSKYCSAVRDPSVLGIVPLSWFTVRTSI